jgi:50S ribosomal protein uL3
MLRSLSAAVGLLEFAPAGHLMRQRADLTCLRDLLGGGRTVLTRDFAAAAAQPALADEEEPPAPGATTATAPSRPRRSGVIAIKAGMTQEWDHWGVRIPLTVLWIDDCQVVQVKRPESDGYWGLQLGAGAKRPKQLPSSLRGHYAAAGVPLKRKLAEFRITADAQLPVGAELRASHFVAGQFVDVTGTSIGKGFQGVMKRWGFAGQPASHGNSLAHRGAGSTGGCQVRRLNGNPKLIN